MQWFRVDGYDPIGDTHKEKILKSSICISYKNEHVNCDEDITDIVDLIKKTYDFHYKEKRITIKDKVIVFSINKNDYLLLKIKDKHYYLSSYYGEHSIAIGKEVLRDWKNNSKSKDERKREYEEWRYNNNLF